MMPSQASWTISCFFFNDTATTEIYTLSLHDALPILFLTLMRPSLVLFLVLWLKLVKDFLKVRCRLALLQRTFKKSFTDRKSGSAGMPRPISYAVFCLKKKIRKARRQRLSSHRIKLST